MNTIRIGVVEDELIVAYDICSLLSEIGYQALQPCATYDAAMAMLRRDKPDIVILDVMLGNDHDGIEVAQHIRATSNIPLLYLTANSDATTVARARETLPDAYLIKPFHKAQLFSAIEVAIFSYQKKTHMEARPQVSNFPTTPATFIKTGEFFEKVLFQDIIFLSSNQNYVTVHTSEKRFLVRATMQDYLDQLNQPHITRIHRSYAVNIHKVEQIGPDSVIVAGQEIPFSKSFAGDLYTIFRIG